MGGFSAASAMSDMEFCEFGAGTKEVMRIVSDDSIGEEQKIQALQDYVHNASLVDLIELSRSINEGDEGDFGQITDCVQCPGALQIFCCNSIWCGCHTCEISEKRNMLAFSGAIFMLMVPEILTGFIEAS